MKKYFLLLITIAALSQLSTYAQAPPDSVLNKFATSDLNLKISEISSYLNHFNKNDSLVTIKSGELIAYFQKQNDDNGVYYTKYFIINRLIEKNDYATALDMALQVLLLNKIWNDTIGILNTINIMVSAYDKTANYTEAIKYLKELTPIYLSMNDKKSLSYTYNNIGAIYAKTFMPDSGLAYGQQSVNIDYALKDSFHLKSSLSTLAENYIARGDYDLAMPFLKKAILIFKDSSIGFYQYIYNDYAQVYLGMKKYDSSTYYAHQALSFAVQENGISEQLRTYEYLYKAFDAMGRQDSSNKYFRLRAVLKDSLFSVEKVKAIEASGFRSLLRQKEFDTEKRKYKDERKQNIQYALIVLGIVTFILLFFLFSRSIVVTEKWISFFGILGLLIIFEFINLLIHPFLEEKTDHSPILMLLALVAIASLLIPMHHRIEKWIKDKITKKNKTIRLEHAKKTIEQLNEKHIQTKDENE
jgi:tetratricopeptide (TPR) repeat protein